MPYQSRGFWCCDFCKLKLDSVEDARQHEVEECQENPNKAQPQQYFQQYFPPQQRYPVHIPPGYYPPPAMAPLTTAAPKTEGADHDAARRSPLRAFPLMGLNEASHMNTEDTIACQSIEIFEASQNLASDEDLRSQYPTLVAGQVGLRCMHCSGNPKQSKEAIIFPANVNSMADNVRNLLDRHLGHCGAAPSQVRDAGQRAATKRQQNEQERASSRQEDERSRRALQELCFHFCQRMGIVDKGPNNAPGLFFNQYSTIPGKPGPELVGSAATDTLASTHASRRRDKSEAAHENIAYRAGYETSFPHGGEGYYSEASGIQTPGHASLEGRHRGSPPPAAYPQKPMTPYDVAGHFPFFQEPNGSWSCKYCSHIHPQYRDPQSIWSAPGHVPPPGQFIDQHLSMCRAYHQSMSSQPMFPVPPPSQYSLMAPPFAGGFGGPPSQGWGGPGPGPQAGSQGQQPLPPPGLMENPANAYLHNPNQAPPHSSSGGVGQHARTTMDPVAGSRPQTTDAAVQRAIDYLVAKEEPPSYAPGTNESDQLVLEEDKLLLTDYFFHLMKQLRLVRFSEGDRKTRGGKREKIKIGYGGLQCIHCSDANNSRKFFWSNVDRLANSFAEIPGHVLKCRHCPQPIKDALLQLKEVHPEQMARLPRGSQKVFFRRMWRRLHDEDPQAKSSPDQANLAPAPSADSADTTKLPAEVKSGNDTSPSGTTGSDESILPLQRSTIEAAKALADSTASSLPPSPTSKVLLAIPEDKEWLSDTDCFIRRQIEVFCATQEDVETARNDRKFPIHEGQVGIRCIHCALAKQGPGARGSGVAYPFSISGIYESVREFQRLHLDTCENVPSHLKAKLSDLKGSTSLSSVLRKYYVLAAKALGLKDTRDGIRAGADSIPLGSQAAFAFSEGGSALSEEMRSKSTVASPDAQSGSFTPVDSRKRKSDEAPGSPGSAKRPNSL